MTDDAQRSATEDTIDLADVFRAVRRGWLIVAACTLLGVLGAFAVLRWVPRKFAGDASVVLRAESGGSSLLNSLGALGSSGGAGGILSSVARSPIETDIAVLQSRAIVGVVIDSLMLQARVVAPVPMASVIVFRSVDLPSSFKSAKFHFHRTPDGYTVTKSPTDSSWSTRNGVTTLPIGRLTFASQATPPGDFDVVLSDREDAILRVTKHLSIGKPVGDLVKIEYRGDDSLTAASVPNAILATYLNWRKTKDRGANQRKVEFLTGAVDSIRRSLHLADDALRRDADSTGILDPAIQGRLELEGADKIRSQLSEVEVESSALEKLIAEVSAGTTTPLELGAYPTFLKSLGFNQLIQEIEANDAALAKLRATRTENDPEITELVKLGARLNGELLPQAKAYAISLSRQLGDMAHQFDSAEASIRTLPGASEANARLEREVLDLSKIYAATQASLVDAQLAAIGEGGDVHPLDLAMPAKKPSFPDPVLTLAAGIGGGALLGVIIAILMSVLGRWVREPRDVERATGVPALRFDPAVPLLVAGSGGGAHTILVVPMDKRTRLEPVVERLIRTALAQSITATVLDLTESNGLPTAGVNGGFEAGRTIAALEAEHGLVVVKLPGIESDAAAATLRPGRPVLLVAPEGRVDRSQLTATVALLRRLNVPCAGVILDGGRRNGAAPHDHEKIAPTI